MNAYGSENGWTTASKNGTVDLPGWPEPVAVYAALIAGLMTHTSAVAVAANTARRRERMRNRGIRRTWSARSSMSRLFRVRTSILGRSRGVVPLTADALGLWLR